MLDREWYPSVFVGLNLVAQTPLNDVVAGVRLPLFAKAGFDLGLDWSKYSYNVVPACTSMCATHSTRHWAGFFAFDYEL
jgi:hypothetical protein